MSTNLSRFFRERRIDLGLRPGDVARQMGYKSLPGACNKLIYFEERGDIPVALFRNLTVALRIDDETITRLIEQDRREYLAQWTAWANEPVEPEIVFRAIPGVFAGHPIPAQLHTTEEMEQYAQEFAIRNHKKTWLVLNRRLRVFFDETGKKSVQEAAPGECNGPYMRLGSSKKRFLFGGEGIMPITEPEKHGPSQ